MYRFGFEISFVRSYKNLIGFSKKTAPLNDRRRKTQLRQVEVRLVRQQLLFEPPDFQILFRMHFDAPCFGGLNVDPVLTARSDFGSRSGVHSCGAFQGGAANNLWNGSVTRR